ncbi:hypothetical protein CDAR_587071 [Caerostris darwini]|uniref:Uncharacterized protein n=1 Tax=Caerostris darwini TaxID=1538125 RepID=A0AAV4WXL3_9ARAC|nr:hypothetical protein CDAR_587071 [Caerostris darwini]
MKRYNMIKSAYAIAVRRQYLRSSIVVADIYVCVAVSRLNDKEQLGSDCMELQCPAPSKSPDISLLLRNGVARSAPALQPSFGRAHGALCEQTSHDVFAFANGIARTENRILLAFYLDYLTDG